MARSPERAELKTSLADEINKGISDMTVSATYRRDKTDPFQTNKNWLISQSMISSKVKAYFSNIQMTKDWENLSSVVSELFSIGGGLPAKNDTTYNVYFCQLLGSLIKTYESYPQSGPMNIDRNEINSHGCDNFYFPGLNHIGYVKNYFPARNGNIDWNALLHVDTMTLDGIEDYNKNFYIL